MDDFSARLGPRERIDFSVMGTYGFGQGNDSGDWLLDLCCVNDLYIFCTQCKFCTFYVHCVNIVYIK